MAIKNKVKSRGGEICHGFFGLRTFLFLDSYNCVLN